MTNKEYADIAKNYKRKVAGTFMLVDGAKLMDKIAGEDFLVTRKYDGAMQILFYENDEACAASTNGVIRKDLPCIEEFKELARASGHKSLTVAAELYAVISKDGRERVGDVATAQSDDALKGKLKLAVFDILDIDGVSFAADHYKKTISEIKSLFSGQSVHPVASKAASSKHEVANIYNEWVLESGAEGLVLRCELPMVYKIKRRHTVDAAVIGYTNGEDGGVRDLLVAVMREDGLLQQFAATGNGMTEEERKKMLERLSGMSVESSYIETDSRNVAFQMVRPEIIVELSAVDFVAENSAGEPKMNILLSYDDENGYSSLGQTPGVAAHSLAFSRIREDKNCNRSDIRISQITDLCAFSEGKSVGLSNLPKSEILTRRVFTKGEGEKQMVQKFIVWKTNKEENPLFPAFVLHYTDFSISRKEQLKRDIRVSNSQTQIMSLLDQFLEENIKKGWAEYYAK